ncbi:sulfotransferase 1C2A-like [Anneissia japonica]|nr:sulfotransferase 1C2A-like [Anneissia japonica]
MKHDLKSVVVQIAKFLGCEIPTGGMEKILSHCSFASMKNNAMTNYSESTDIRQDISPFLRKGVVGDWKNYFTVAQNQAFDKIYYEKLKGSGLVFDFEM